MRAANARGAPRTRPRTIQDEAVARFFHGLLDPTRVPILRYLIDEPKTAGEICRVIAAEEA